jgi:hypothetical protein
MLEPGVENRHRTDPGRVGESERRPRRPGVSAQRRDMGALGVREPGVHASTGKQRARFGREPAGGRELAAEPCRLRGEHGAVARAQRETVGDQVFDPGHVAGDDKGGAVRELTREAQVRGLEPAQHRAGPGRSAAGGQEVGHGRAGDRARPRPGRRLGEDLAGQPSGRERFAVVQAHQ